MFIHLILIAYDNRGVLGPSSDEIGLHDNKSYLLKSKVYYIFNAIIIALLLHKSLPLYVLYVGMNIELLY